MEYRIVRIHKVWKFQCAEHSLFASYVDTWLQLKTKANGWPDSCTKPAQREAYIDDYERTEGIRLDPAEIEKNPCLRSLAKLMLNFLWRKFGQRENLMQVRAFYDLNPSRLFLNTDQHDVQYVNCCVPF